MDKKRKGDSMNDIVRITNDRELVVSLEDISAFSGVKYESIQKMMRNNRDVFLTIGLSLPKESDFKSVSLNEEQSTLLMMFMKNTPQVKEFKIKLVQEFFKMREYLRSGSIINDELKKHIEQFIPKGGYLEENANGELKTKPIRGYFRVDKFSNYAILLNKKYQLQKRVNSLLREEYELEIKMVEIELAEIEKENVA